MNRLKCLIFDLHSLKYGMKIPEIHANPKWKSDGTFIVFDTSIGCDNLGDEIISFYCNRILKDLSLRVIQRVATQRTVTREENDILKTNADVGKIIMGTNVVLRNVFGSNQWMLPEVDERMQHLVLMGVGLDHYNRPFDWGTQKFYRTFLEPSLLHSVRDSETEKALKKIGIDNVINTACPTMWKFTKDFCRKIPREKAENVITTITDYGKSCMDWTMLDVLLSEYQQVYVWLQGEGDLEYLKNYSQFSKLNIIKYELKSYQKALNLSNIDYVGTRLHAGIMALNHKKRSLIISIDDRAATIAKDTQLPILDRNQVGVKLREYILRNNETKIQLPEQNINRWKNQFL